MKKLILSLVLALTILSPLSTIGVNTAKAGAYLTTNSAIRGTSTDTVYWYATDGKRYVFPNAQSFYSWFPNFNNVSIITDAELYAITIGGNVTFRPGAKLVKVNTDPRVYAVSRGGVLRHVTSEYLATQLYGSDWNTKVADIADVYFTNYTVGTPIYSTSDYNVSNEYNGVTTPSDSLRGMTSGNITVDGQITLLASRTNIAPGEAVTLSVTNTDNYGSGYRAEIYDTRTNSLIRTCEAPFSYSVNDIFRTVSCSTTVYPQRNSTESSVQYYAVIRNSASTVIKNAFSPVIYFGSTAQTGTLTMDADRRSIAQGESVYLIATYNGTLPSGGRVEIKEVRTGNTIKSCYNTPTCYVTTYPNQTGYTSTQYYAVVLNASGTQLVTKYGSTITFDGIVVSQVGTVTLAVDRASITNGQAITLQASYTRASTSNFSHLQIFRVNTVVGTVAKTCYVDSCSFTESPTETRSYAAYVYDITGHIVAWSNTITVVVDSATSQTGTLTLTTDRATFASGEGVTFTATYNGTIPSGGKIEFRQPQYPFNLQAECFNTNTCSRTLYANVDALYNSISVSASVYDINNVQVANKSLTIYRSGVSTSYGENSINGLVLNADRTTINSGELVHLTANAFNSGTWSYVGNRIEISSVNTGQILRTCYDVATCTLDVYPQAQSATNLTAQYQTRIYDRTGTLAMSQYSPVIYLNGATVNTNPNSGSMTGTGSVSFGPTENLRTNRMMYLTTTFLNSNLAVADAKVELYVENLSTPLATCLGSYTCAVSYATGATPVSTRVYARLSNRNNASQWLETPRVAFTTTW